MAATAMFATRPSGRAPAPPLRPATRAGADPRVVTNVALAVLTPGLILAVPIFDSLTVAWLRIAHGGSVFQGGTDHPSHRLVALGLSERRAVLLLCGLSALSGIAGLLAWQLDVLPWGRRRLWRAWLPWQGCSC
ncbi:MAG: hypothetical protein FJX73_11980 [Armatimonadetes bacterium]|nr:hypothetical protein [Armatimonadota bacterium]